MAVAMRKSGFENNMFADDLLVVVCRRGSLLKECKEEYKECKLTYIFKEGSCENRKRSKEQ